MKQIKYNEEILDNVDKQFKATFFTVVLIKVKGI
jgi:hypothetical protein